MEIGGKRINFSLTNQYHARIYATVIRHNSQQLLSTVYNKVYDEVPPSVAEFDRKRMDRVKKKRENRRKNGRKRKYKQKKKVQENIMVQDLENPIKLLKNYKLNEINILNFC